MHKWKYHSLVLRDLSISDARLNAEGEKGWELISVCMLDANTARAFFKMPCHEEECTGETENMAVVKENR